MCTAVGISSSVYDKYFRKAKVSDLISLEQKLYFRFLKNEGCYIGRFIRLFDYNDIKGGYLSFAQLFDKKLNWNSTLEGNLFWYEKQIKLVVFLIKMNYKDKPMMLKYLANLFNRYSCSADNKEWYKEALKFYKENT